MTFSQIKRRIWQRISKPFYKLVGTEGDVQAMDNDDMYYDRLADKYRDKAEYRRILG